MKKRRFLKLIIALLVLAALLIYDSNSRLVVTDYEFASTKLPESFDGFTVVQLSDLHGASFGKNNAALIKKTAEAEPDIIVITGDMVDEERDFAVADKLLAELVKIAPVYYVSGNHEWAMRCMEKMENMLAEHGATYFSNSYELIDRGEDSIVLAGAEDPNGPADMIKPPELIQNIRNEQGERFVLLLGHRNYWAEKYPRLDAELILCGHAHGGIVRLPFVGGVLGTGFGLFPDYVDGMVDTGSCTMIVSRGLGNSIPVPRFLNNPEIVVVRLQSR